MGSTKNYTCNVSNRKYRRGVLLCYILNEAMSCEPSPKEGAQKGTVPKHLIIRILRDESLLSTEANTWETKQGALYQKGFQVFVPSCDTKWA